MVQELRYGGEEGAEKRGRRDYPDHADAILHTHRADIAQRAARQCNAMRPCSCPPISPSAARR